jgi:hypothetical protein
MLGRSRFPRNARTKTGTIINEPQAKNTQIELIRYLSARKNEPTLSTHSNNANLSSSNPSRTPVIAIS